MIRYLPIAATAQLRVQQLARAESEAENYPYSFSLSMTTAPSAARFLDIAL
jgi:hypothetical protein